MKSPTMAPAMVDSMIGAIGNAPVAISAPAPNNSAAPGISRPRTTSDSISATKNTAILNAIGCRVIQLSRFCSSSFMPSLVAGVRWLQCCENPCGSCYRLVDECIAVG